MHTVSRLQRRVSSRGYLNIRFDFCVVAVKRLVHIGGNLVAFTPHNHLLQRHFSVAGTRYLFWSGRLRHCDQNGDRVTKQRQSMVNGSNHKGHHTFMIVNVQLFGRESESKWGPVIPLCTQKGRSSWIQSTTFMTGS